MNRKKIFSAAFVFMFMFVSFWVSAEEAKNSPVAISPGSDTQVTSVWQRCPTFSWSAVDQASSYRIAVFEVFDPQVMGYEDMAAMTSPVISKDIPGPALSWTLSSDESLNTGSMYAWYVRAVDAYGNALGRWSGGKIFKVEQEVHFAGIEEKLAEKLREYGMDEETITNVLTDLKSEVKEVVVRSDESRDLAKDTQGKSSVQGYEGSSNTFYGLYAGSSITSGFDNAFFGESAGHSTITGFYNTFLGQGSGYQNTDGSYNTFVGKSAGSNNIGNNNTFVGTLAGYYNTGGGGNIFIGNSAGNKNTTGSTNIFLGNSTGYSNTTANDNIFIGEQSGYFNTTGTGNIYLGHATGYNNSIGSGNIFLGDAAGFTNTTGSYNIFLGDGSGNWNTTGGWNTFIGNGTGRCNTTGIKNVFLGLDAGYLNATGQGNVFLGFKAGFNETGSNKLYIANSDTISPLIYGEFDNNIVTINGKLGIGTKTPGYPVELSTSGQNAEFATTRTDGACCYISGGLYRGFFGTKTNHPLRIVVNDTWKMEINESGHYINMIDGGYYDGTWHNASSRDVKENIQSLNPDEAKKALEGLNPVKYNYIANKEEEHVGFIAEEVPDLVATKDRKALSSMDIVAVLTRVVKEQQKMILEQQQVNRKYNKIISELHERIAKIERER